MVKIPRIHKRGFGEFDTGSDQGVERTVRKTLLSVTKDRKLWRAMITQLEEENNI